MTETQAHEQLAKRLASTLDADNQALLIQILKKLLEAQAQGQTGCELTAAEAAQLAPLPCVSDQGDAPLYLQGQWLQFQRLWRKEQQILQRLHSLAEADGDSNTLPAEIHQAAIKANLHEEKLRAIAQALNQRLTLLTGGPGTGKTTTLTWLLAAWLENRPDTSLALCAPTGKAAQRMRTALDNALKDLPENLPSQATLKALTPTTLHRLLGIEALSGQPRHHAHHLLPYQLVVVDETSMVDVYTMAKLVEALPENASLILMGDPQQLPSVEVGQVLEMLISRFPQTHVSLTQSHRSNETIQTLASTVLEGNADSAWMQLSSGEHDTLCHLGEKIDLAQLAQGYQPYLAQLNTHQPVEDQALSLLHTLSRYRILTALRQGPYGATRLNQQLVEYFRSQGQLPYGRGQYFAGHAIQITENDYTLGLFNGDMGVMLPTHKGDQSVWFQGEAGQLKRVPFLQLPGYETAFVTTVHKAQGDEFDTTVLILPPQPHPLVTRKLIYTALTRAREQFQLIATESSFKASLKNRTENTSAVTSNGFSEVS